MYESPIKIIQDRIQMDMENDIMKVVQRYNIDVDKDELLKALKYDREQYDKGFSDCKAIYEKKLEKILERLEEMRKVTDVPTIHSYCNTTISNAIKIVKEEGGIE